VLPVHDLLLANHLNFSTQRRDWRAEEAHATSSHAIKVAEIRGLRDSGQLVDVYQTAQVLILCGLPYKPTPMRQSTRKARLGDGSILTVTFIAVLDGVAIPYGADRTVLHWILDRAVKGDDRFVSWRSAQDFLSDVGLSKSGKNICDLRARVQRLKGMAVSIQRTSNGAEESLVLPVIRKSSLPASICGRQQEGPRSILTDDGTRRGLELDAEFFAELKKFHVVVPREIINRTRNSPQLQDCVLFLYWRAFAAQKESLIPWQALRDQIWQGDKTLTRVRLRFDKAIRWLKGVWPELRAEVRRHGLWVAPPISRRYLRHDTQRRLTATP
jgi:hypothetical protein